MGLFNVLDEDTPILTEQDLQEMASKSFNEVYGALVNNAGDEQLYNAIQQKVGYKFSKVYNERVYPELDRSVLTEISSLMRNHEGLEIKFVPSKTAFIELEADFKPSNPDKTGRKESFKIVVFAENGEKVFEKSYTEEEAFQVKAERVGAEKKKSKKKKLSLFGRRAKNEDNPQSDGSGLEK